MKDECTQADPELERADLACENEHQHHRQIQCGAGRWHSDSRAAAHAQSLQSTVWCIFTDQRGLKTCTVSLTGKIQLVKILSKAGWMMRPLPLVTCLSENAVLFNSKCF